MLALVLASPVKTGLSGIIPKVLHPYVLECFSRLKVIILHQLVLERFIYWVQTSLACWGFALSVSFFTFASLFCSSSWSKVLIWNYVRKDFKKSFQHCFLFVDECHDDTLQCNLWATNGHCRGVAYAEFMKRHCKATCGYCGRTSMKNCWTLFILQYFMISFFLLYFRPPVYYQRNIKVDEKHHFISRRWVWLLSIT